MPATAVLLWIAMTVNAVIISLYDIHMQDTVMQVLALHTAHSICDCSCKTSAIHYRPCHSLFSLVSQSGSISDPEFEPYMTRARWCQLWIFCLGRSRRRHNTTGNSACPWQYKANNEVSCSQPAEQVEKTKKVYAAGCHNGSLCAQKQPGIAEQVIHAVSHFCCKPMSLSLQWCHCVWLRRSDITPHAKLYDSDDDCIFNWWY